MAEEPSPFSCWRGVGGERRRRRRKKQAGDHLM